MTAKLAVSRLCSAISNSTPLDVSIQAELWLISEGTSYPALRLVFRPYSQVTRMLVHNTGCGPPPSFRSTSPCPGIDQRPSGLIPVTSRAFTRRSSPACAGCELVAFAARKTFEMRIVSRTFAAAPPRKRLSLATGMNSLPRSSKRTPGHWACALACPELTITDWLQILFTAC